MSRSRTAAFWLAVAFVILVVVVWVGRKRRFIQRVNTVVLVSDGPGPFSLMPGQTIHLHYSINTVKTHEFKPWPVKPGQVIYAELAPEATTWSLVGVQAEPPSEIPAGYAVLQGTIQAGTQWESHPVNQLRDFSDPGWLATQASTAVWRNYWRGFGQQETGFYYLGHLPEGTTAYLALNSENGGPWNEIGMDVDLNHVLRLGGPNSRTIILQGILGPPEEYKILYIQYGLETYQVSEDIAQKMNSILISTDSYFVDGASLPMTRGRLRVDISVDANGISRIKSVTIITEPPATIPSAPSFSAVPSAG